MTQRKKRGELRLQTQISWMLRVPFRSNITLSMASQISNTKTDTMKIWCPPFLLFSVGVSAWSANALATPRSTHAAAAAAEVQAMREWLLAEDRLKPTSVELSLSDDDDTDQSKFVVSTTRTVARGEVLFRLCSDAVWSAADAYQDRDLGPKMRDFAEKAGPGFAVVALSSALAAEKVRRYRSIEGQGNAPESTGFSIPSDRGAFARWLWSIHDREGKGGNIGDESLMDTVLKGVNLIVPLLDVAARRAWSAAAADDSKPTARFLSKEWAREAMFNDGSALSWSRGELESVAMSSFALVLERQKPPPPFLLSGVGSLIPEPFLDPNAPEMWPSGEPLALVPLVDDLYSSDVDDGATNAVFGSPPRGQQRLGQDDDCLWCVATRELQVGERIVASNPWNVLST